MNTQKKIQEFAETALSQVDSLGFQLDTMGVENQINRHNLIALLMFGKKRFEGEMDSLNTRIDSGKIKINDVKRSAEQLLASAASLAAFPATYTIERLKAQL